MSWAPISELAEEVVSGKTSATTLVEKSLNIIEEKKQYNAIITTLADNARARAKLIDKQVRNGKNPGPLAGVPFIAKDNFLVYGSDTTAASNILKGFKPPYQATAINRLESAGAICVAKANLDAFAHGASTENSDYFVTKNPYDRTRVPGGSSGGSAAAVALGMAPFALGTDTGGSIRQPASFCGVFGLKPTYGLVSRSGVVAMGSSLDCIGPITTSVEDAAMVLNIISGKDELDATTIDKDAADYDKADIDLKQLTVGVIREYMSQGVNNEVLQAVNKAIADLKTAGVKIVDISLPSLPLALACYYIICPAEVSSNLSRYDGQRYGYSADDATDLDQSYLLSRGRGFGDEAKRRIMIGTHVLSSGYYDAYYKKAQTVRTKLINEFKSAFKDVQIMIGPVAPTTAFKIGENSTNPLSMYLSDVMTVAANLCGIPAVSLPIGYDSLGLPVGLQLMANQRQDRQLLAFAKAVEELKQ